ncbi:hypothetical protein B0H16DRAFT_1801443 [Mycena metata]|uniref:Uncharacterized protein n=1 Tax=Mycena metata TaxID=1033252 RepID=A0AAD7HB45_9AGAR|nr:hypothetical protein B0H16DRAFT_1801443 [Mycena metata]
MLIEDPTSKAVWQPHESRGGFILLTELMGTVSDPSPTTIGVVNSVALQSHCGPRLDQFYYTSHVADHNHRDQHPTPQLPRQSHFGLSLDQFYHTSQVADHSHRDQHPTPQLPPQFHCGLSHDQFYYTSHVADHNHLSKHRTPRFPQSHCGLSLDQFYHTSHVADHNRRDQHPTPQLPPQFHCGPSFDQFYYTSHIQPHGDHYLTRHNVIIRSAYNPGPVSPVTFSEVKTSHMGITTSPDITLSSAPVSSTFKAYNPGPVSPVTFSEVKTSFSAIAVSSNILTAEVFLYGAYVVMFGLYLKVLRSGGIAKNRGLTVATILLFILCTAHCALQISTSTLYNQAESRSIGNSEALFDQTFKDYSSVVIATNAVYVTSKCILRCYAIWNFQLKIVFVPVLLTFAVADPNLSRLPGVGYANAFWPLHTPNALRSADLVVAEFSFKLLKISILLSICTTVILMVLTAGRIWWIAQTARTLLGRTAISKYHTACAMILESGAIYCVSAIAFATIGFTLDQVYWTTGAILGQVVGIAPTIIAVRVGLGHSVSSVESFEVMTQGGEIYASLPQSRTKGARSGDEEAVEDPYRRSRKHARRFNLNTTSTSSLMRPGSVLYIRSDDSI